MKNYYEHLNNLCIWNMPEQISEVLSEHQEQQQPLDVTYDEGDLFVATLNGNYEVLPILITHYKENFIDRYKENKEYYLQKRAEQNLSETIQSVVDMGIKLPSSVQNLFALYLAGQDSADSDHEQDIFSDDENSAQEFMRLCEDSNMIFAGTSQNIFNASDQENNLTLVSGDCISNV